MGDRTHIQQGWRRTGLWLAVVALFGLIPRPLLAAEEGEGNENISEVLIHHTADGYYVALEPFVTIELPRIFLVQTSEGSWRLDAFGSTASALHSGRYVADYEGHRYESSAELEELIAAHHHLYAELHPREGELVLDLSITRHYVFGLIAALLVLALFIPVAQRYRKGIGRTTAPRGVLQNLAEVFIVFVRDEIARPNIGEKADRFLPYLLTAFFFILFCNLLGLVPNLGAATSNLAVTGVLALFTFIIGTIYASKDHWKHIFWPPGVPVFVKPILIPVEIMGLFTRHAALAIRLFANMTAGTLVILSLIGLIFMINALFGALAAWMSTLPSVLLTLFISAIKLLVAFIQAYVFTLLSALFIGMSVAEHDHEHHEHEEEAGNETVVHAVPTSDGARVVVHG